MNGEEFLKWCNRVRSFALTKLIASSFSSFGPESKITPPIRLNGATRMQIGARVYIGNNCWLNCVDNPEKPGKSVLLSIGDDVIFSGGCTVSAALDLRIDDRALIGHGVFISDHNHSWGEGRTLRTVGATAAVIIGYGSWIGHNACVLPGVTIGAGAIVGANSVVTKDIPPGGVAVGAPARVLKIQQS